MITLVLNLLRMRLRWWWWAVIVLFDLAIIVVVTGVGGMTYVHVQGNKRWAAYRADAEKRGVKLDFTDFIPPPVSDVENYAAIPLFEQAFALGLEGRETEVFDFPPIPKRSPRKPEWIRELERNAPPHIVARFAPKEPVKAGPPPSQLEVIRDEFIKRKWIPVEQKDAPPAEAVLSGLERFKPQLAQLHDAALQPKCRFQTDWRLALTAKLPHFTVLMTAARVWDSRIRANLELGHGDAALSDVSDMFAAHRAVGTEPGLIAGLVRISLFGIANAGITAGLQNHRWTEPQLAAIEHALAQFDCLADCQQWLSSERAASNQAMDWAFGHYQPEGVPRPDAQDDLLGKTPRSMRRFSGWGRWNQTFINQGFDDYLAHLDVTSGRWHGGFEVEHDVAKLKGTERNLLIFAGLMLPVFDSFIKKTLWLHTQHQLLRIAIAIERHRLARGTLPSKLDDLVPAYLPAVPLDVFDGKPLFYRAKPDGTFRIYGVALNRTDDGGAVGEDDEPMQASDWTWPLPAGD